MAASLQDYEFFGWMGLDKDCVKNSTLTRQKFTPKPFTEDDVDIKVTHCGICGTDIHILTSGWGPTLYPCCVGHEIVGTAVRVGSNVKHIKVGERAGVGAQSDSCGQCEQCLEGQENYCTKMVGTYASPYADGSISYGGYANYSRHPGHFVLKIPDELPSGAAAPLLCGGATVYAPMVRNSIGPGKSIGIIGIGGLGHMGVQLAKAMGADKVVAISRNSSKKDDALKLGATDFIATAEDEKWAEKHARTLDLIVCTVSSAKMPLNDYLSLLKYKGNFVQVGAPEEPLPPLTAFSLVLKQAKFGGSFIASPGEIRDMLELAAQKGVRPWTQEFPIDQVNEALKQFEEGKPRYRFVLVNPQD